MNITKRALAVILSVVMLLPVLPLSTFAAEEYTLSFNVNGGAGGPEDMSVAAGTNVTIPSVQPTRNGMVFRGWAESAYDAAVGNIAYSSDAASGHSTSITVTEDTTLFAVYAYTVTLRCGREGAGTSSFTLYKYTGKELSLCHDKASIAANYGMYPKNNDQRSFIEWNTQQDSRTSKGTGTAYHVSYTENASVTLYAIWGYAILYNADGGTFPSNDRNVFQTYVCDYDGVTYSDPRTLYGNFDFPSGSNLPVKDGCRLYTNNGTVFYGLLYNDMRFFTTESAAQNLTIPPVNPNGLSWDVFHTSYSDYGNYAPEFYAIWEPSVTYKANGGTGSDVSEYLTWDWDALYDYNPYTVRNNTFSKSGATFTGWNTMPDGSGRSYSAGYVMRSFSNSDPIVLYAQWSDGTHGSHVVEKNYVSFDANGGWDAPATQTKYWGSILTLSSKVPVRYGYKFMGWGNSREATSPSYNAGSLYGFDTDVVLYAIWEECTEHDFLCESEGASGCLGAAVNTYTCSLCALTYTEEVKAGEHNFGDWIVTTDPTYTDEGEETRTCSLCGETETRPVDKLEKPAPAMEVSVSGNVLTITNATNIQYIRYAKGEYDTVEEINASGNYVNLPASKIYANIADDVFTYEMPGGGTYTLWLKLVDRTYKIVTVEVESSDPFVTVDGVDVTVTNLAGVKDFFIAKGDYNSYSELKKDYIVRVTSSKIGDKNSYTYRVNDSGSITVLIRYEDPSKADVVLKATIDVITPTYTVNGLQVKVDNLEGAKAVRTAYGEYKTVSQIKNAEGCRSFKVTAVNEDEGFNIQYRENGVVTIAVQYNNGYTDIKHIEIKQKTPTVVQDKNKVTFGDLDDLYVIRYAFGEYETASEIKRAEGSIAVKSSKIDENGNIVITLKKAGTYTFCVQYNDESFNYYKITVE